MFDHLMFIDSDRSMNYYHKVILKKSGLTRKVNFIESNESALKHFESLEKIPSFCIPDVLFIDSNMDILNNYDFLQRLDNLKLKKSLKIVLLSNTTESPLHRLLVDSFGLIIDFVEKPISEEYLEALLKKFDLQESIFTQIQ